MENVTIYYSILVDVPLKLLPQRHQSYFFGLQLFFFFRQGSGQGCIGALEIAKGIILLCKLLAEPFSFLFCSVNLHGGILDLFGLGGISCWQGRVEVKDLMRPSKAQ